MRDPREREHDTDPSGPGSDTDNLDISSLQESGLTQAYETTEHGVVDEDVTGSDVEANLILIAHPDGQRLGTRLRMTSGTSLEVGRAPSSDISLPEVLSISRQHARIHYRGRRVALEDLGSTNGTYVNGQLINGPTVLHSGDRFQVAAVHFKFLHEQDPEHAYYETIYDLMTRDGLTEIFNKRKYEEEAEREFARAVRHDRPLSLIMFDLDDFKLINDNYGHLCGDFVLKQVTSLVRELIRPEQVFARVGGDEFVILAPETDSQGAVALASKLRERIAGLEYHYCDFTVSVTCSFGVAQFETGMVQREDLYEAADQALFLSKRAGRNRVTLAAASADTDGPGIPS
ncbi:MAG: GGDEF domain-containing protein [Acidobacteriota bacterium]